MNERVEEVYRDKPWALEPIEGIECVCSFRKCDISDIKGKKGCMKNGCPYDIEGDDGFI